MPALLESSNPFWGWLLKSSTQASVLIVLVLLVQWLFRKKLSPRWRYALWWLVLVRLMMPVSLESTVSIFNLAKVERGPTSRPVPNAKRLQTSAQYAPSPQPDMSPQAYIYPINPPRILDDQPQSSKQVATLGAKAAPAPQRLWLSLRARLATLIPLLPTLWVCGVILLVGRILLEQIRLTHRMRACRVVNDAAVLDLLEECKRCLGVEGPLSLIETSQVRSPALYGVLRPWLLLPEGLLQNFNQAGLRHVFLHELSHVKRRDIAVNWLATALQVLHWFNPLVWFAFNRMRADCELACDALALSCVETDESKAYGQTIIKLLEGSAHTSPGPGLVGILEDKELLKRRIRMIAQFNRHGRWGILSALLLVGLGVICLTDAQSERQINGLGKLQTAFQPGHDAHLYLSLECKGIPFGQYDSSLMSVIQQNWGRLQEERKLRVPKPQTAAFAIELEPTGRIQVLPREGTKEQEWTVLCRQAITHASPHTRWSQEMRRLVGENSRKFKIVFHISSKSSALRLGGDPQATLNRNAKHLQ